MIDTEPVTNADFQGGCSNCTYGNGQMQELAYCPFCWVGNEKSPTVNITSTNPPTIAFDLDGTLAIYDGWKGADHFGPMRVDHDGYSSSEALKELKNHGHRIIIWTTRGNKEGVRDWLNSNDIPFDYINENPDQPPGSSQKIAADLYPDDRAIDARKPLREIVGEIKDRLSHTQTDNSLIGDLRARLLHSGAGFTYHVIKRSEPKEGFAVSIYPERSVGVHHTELIPKHISNYIRANKDLLRNDEHYFGPWHDPSNGKVSLDVSVVKNNENEARQLALAHDQKAYYNIATGETIIVNPEATSGGALTNQRRSNGERTTGATSRSNSIGRLRHRNGLYREGNGPTRNAGGASGGLGRLAQGPSSRRSRRTDSETKEEREEGYQRRRTANNAAGQTGEGGLQGRSGVGRSPGELEPPGSPSTSEMAEGSLIGLPKTARIGDTVVSVQHSPHIRRVAEEYMRENGLPYNPPTHYVKADPERGKRIADEFDKMEHNPNHPETKASYEAMARETIAQYHAAVKHGLKVEFIPGDSDPYDPSPRNAIEDIQKNNHMWVFPTSEGFGTEGPDRSDHPALRYSGIHISGKPATINDIFRVVHDYFGHAKEGNGMRAQGEENAWRIHSAMYSPLARKAMTSETRGQNSWVNFGPHAKHNANASGKNTIYSDQKAGLLPDWVINEGATDEPTGNISSQEAVLQAKIATLEAQAATARTTGLGERGSGEELLSLRGKAHEHSGLAFSRYRIGAFSWAAKHHYTAYKNHLEASQEGNDKALQLEAAVKHYKAYEANKRASELTERLTTHQLKELVENVWKEPTENVEIDPHFKPDEEKEDDTGFWFGNKDIGGGHSVQLIKDTSGGYPRIDTYHFNHTVPSGKTLYGSESTKGMTLRPHHVANAVANLFVYSLQKHRPGMVELKADASTHRLAIKKLNIYHRIINQVAHQIPYTIRKRGDHILLHRKPTENVEIDPHFEPDEEYEHSNGSWTGVKHLPNGHSVALEKDGEDSPEYKFTHTLPGGRTLYPADPTGGLKTAPHHIINAVANLFRYSLLKHKPRTADIGAVGEDRTAATKKANIYHKALGKVIHDLPYSIVKEGNDIHLYRHPEVANYNPSNPRDIRGKWQNGENFKVEIKGKPYSLTKVLDGWHVVSLDKPEDRFYKNYAVGTNEHGLAAECSCPQFTYRGGCCKHMEAVNKIESETPNTGPARSDTDSPTAEPPTENTNGHIKYYQSSHPGCQFPLPYNSELTDNEWTEASRRRLRKRLKQHYESLEPATGEIGTPEEIEHSRKLAYNKILNAPVPSPEQVEKARAELKAGGRAGGESRGGNARDRQRQRLNLFKEWGGVEKGYIVDPHTGLKMHWTDDPEENPNQHPKFERGKIFTKTQGGGYQLHNLIPESPLANRTRSDDILREENLDVS